MKLSKNNTLKHTISTETVLKKKKVRRRDNQHTHSTTKKLFGKHF